MLGCVLGFGGYREESRRRANEPGSHIYLGLAGESGSGRVVQSGLYRLPDGSDEWEALQRGLGTARTNGPGSSRWVSLSLELSKVVL